MNPSLVEVDRSGIGLYPSAVEVELWLYCPIGGCKVKRGVWYSYSGLEILHGGEGGDVELGAQTSKHILVFAFDPISLDSLFILCKASSISTFHIISIACICALHIFILLHLLYAWIACVCLTYT